MKYPFKFPFKIHMKYLYQQYFKHTKFQVLLIECCIAGLYLSPIGEPKAMLIGFFIMLPTIYLLGGLHTYLKWVRPALLEVEHECNLQMKYSYMYNKFIS